MALFEGRKDRVDSRETMTLVGEEAYFNGLLAVKGSLRVEGVVEGDVTDAVTVEIGKKGRVKGNIAGESVLLHPLGRREIGTLHPVFEVIEVVPQVRGWVRGFRAIDWLAAGPRGHRGPR